jgi:hypothetical protein
MRKLATVVPCYFIKKTASENKDSILLGPNALELTSLGAAGLGSKAYYDINRALKKVDEWDANLAKLRPTTTATRNSGLFFNKTTNKWHPVEELKAQQALDAYIKGGTEATNSRILGLKAGNVPKMFTAASGVLESREPLLGLLFKKDKEGYKKWINDIKARSKKGMLHYDLFMNSKHPSDLTGHFIEKGMSSKRGMTEAFMKKYPEEMKKLFHSPGPLMAKLKLAPAEIRPQIIESILGIGLDSNTPKDNRLLLPENAGEIQRLVGNEKTQVAASTIYKDHLGKVRNLNKFAIKPLALGAGVFSLGSYLTRNLKKEASELSNEDLADLTAITATSALSPNLINQGVARLSDPYNKKLGITFGEVDIENAHVGRGHAEPALAIEELLKRKLKENAGNYKKTSLFNLNPEDVILERIVRNKAGVLEHPGGKFNAIINTGFGITTPNDNFDGNLRGKGLKTTSNFKADTLMNYLTDMVASEKPSLGATTKDYLRGAKTEFLGYGPGFKNLRKKDIEGLQSAKFVNIGDGTSPAISESVLSLLKNAPETPDQARQYLYKALQDPNKFKGREDTANRLKSFLDSSNGKNVLVISGASRGDYVASRARDAALRLKELGDTDTKILAQMGTGAFNDPRQMEMIKGLEDYITPIGFMPKDTFNAAQALGLHAMNSGTSSKAEAISSKTPLVIPGDKNSWGYTIDYGTIKKPNNKVSIEPGSIADRFRELISKGTDVPANVDDYGQAAIATWNDGNIEYTKGLKGVAQQKGYDMRDVVDLVRDRKLMQQLSDEAAKRGPEELAKIMQARENLANHTIQTLRKNFRNSKIKGLGSLGLGLGSLGLGGKSMYDLFNRNSASQKESPIDTIVNQPGKENKFNWENLLKDNRGKAVAAAVGGTTLGLLANYLYRKRKKKLSNAKQPVN